MNAAIEGIDVRGKLVRDEPLARHCSWRTGGAAERFFEPEDIDDVLAYLSQIDADEPITWLGLGSNVLVRDGGIDGTVIAARRLNKFRWLDQTRMHVECGTPCAKVAREAAKKNLGGGSFLAAIPGTMGGALAMNAGAFGRETWMLVESVDLLNRSQLRRDIARSAFNVTYRKVDLSHGEWFASAVLSFATDNDDEPEIRALLSQKNAAQPTGLASCGSVFKNPPGDFAGRLIEAAGLKGTRRGGAHVSTKHANFIINDEDASAADIEQLIDAVRTAVADRFGLELEPEVRFIGKRAVADRVVN